MTENYNRLIKILKELFQIDRPDLDFGIYRIMNQKRDEISAFMDNDLLPQVRKAFVEHGQADTDNIQAELDAAAKQAENLGVDPEQTAKVQALREKLVSSTDVAALENEVYSHLYNFFSRYYQDGDFLSLRRYKKDVYAIPYEGEEVKLHWANADQYYIKSSENFRDYTFKIGNLPGPGQEDKRKAVQFKLVEADTEVANNKAQSGNERRFVLCADNPMIEENGQLIIRFEYQPVKEKQDALNKKAVKRLLEILNSDPAYKAWLTELARYEPTEKNRERTTLEKHLTTYTAKNTFDYFIHKDLGGFLRRELDFYIKNEVMHLDDIEEETVPRVEQYLSQIKVIRRIAHKIIMFLEQIENFQKKLWLKKKFVVETNYCVTLDRIPEDMYPEIAANQDQHDEWINLFAINEIKADLAKPGYSKPLTTEFLKANDKLVLDTRFFDQSFKSKLVASLDDFDEQCDGLLVHSENFQALNLLQERYREQVKCVYIDPPFNLGQNGDYLYRTDYKDSTWAALLFDRIKQSRNILLNDGIFYLRCDYNGNFIARSLIDSIFGRDGFQYELCVQRIRKNVTGQGKISLPLANDSLFMAFNSKYSELADPYLKLNETRKAYWRRIDDSAGFRNPPERVIFGKTFYPYKKDAHFKYSQNSINEMITEGRIKLTCKNRSCDYEHHSGEWIRCPKCASKEATPKYLVKATDTKILDTNWMDIAGYSSRTGFSTENAESLLKRAIDVATFKNELVADYFAGSGTALDVSLKNQRRWLGVEMGDQFNDYIVPRLKKSCREENISHCFKYIRLESYEDTLNNLSLKRTKAQAGLLSQISLREEYMLSYMMNEESKKSPSLLNLDRFVDPWNYTLKIATGSAGETRTQTVDLVETFNYLIGLCVIRREMIKGFEVIEGKKLRGEKVLVIWRNTKETSNEKLDDFFRKQDFNPRDTEFDLIYVNGDNNLENLRRADETWKVRLIEDDFKRLMFDVEDV